MLKTPPLFSTVNTQADLAAILEVKESALDQAVRRAPFLYRNIELKKKDGTPRFIKAPTDDLKGIQRAILDKVLILVPVSRQAYGLGKGKGIVENAQLHTTSRYMLNADIKDFFPSVHFTRVKCVFLSLGISTEMAEILTKLATFDFALPPGAPTSPYIATLALKKLDRRLMGLCRLNRLTYSRYFDDITISGGDRAHAILGTLEQIISAEGYEMHKRPGKLRLSGPVDEKLVTGIVIKNGKLEAPQVKDVLEYLHALQNEGLSALRGENPFKEKASLRGKINFIGLVEPEVALMLGAEFDKVVW